MSMFKILTDSLGHAFKSEVTNGKETLTPIKSPKKKIKHEGRNENGQFIEGSKLAQELGRIGGKKAQELGSAHKLTREERILGGANSKRT